MSDYLALRQAATEHERLALLSGCTEHIAMALDLRRRAVDLRLGSHRPRRSKTWCDSSRATTWARSISMKQRSARTDKNRERAAPQ
jgi:hypothetical protein